MQIAQEFDKQDGGVCGYRVPTMALIKNQSRVNEIYVGMGFRTEDNILGAVKAVDVKGRITRWRELWDQDFINTFPCTVQAMRRFYVLETDRDRMDTIEADRVISSFLIMPIALISAQDISSEGNVCVVGSVKINSGGRAPFDLHGLEKVPAEQLLECLHYKTSVFERMNLSSFLMPLRAAIDNFLVNSACSRPEDSAKDLNTLDLSYSIPGPVCMAVLFAFTVANSRVSAFSKCCLTVSFADDWCSLEKIMGRNAHKTEVPGLGGNIFEAGGPIFKLMVLPISKIVMAFRNAKLLTPGGTGAVLNNQGSAGAAREFSARLREPRLCYFCLRTKRIGHATHLCACDGADDSDDDFVNDVVISPPTATVDLTDD